MEQEILNLKRELSDLRNEITSLKSVPPPVDTKTIRDIFGKIDSIKETSGTTQLDKRKTKATTFFEQFFLYYDGTTYKLYMYYDDGSGPVTGNQVWKSVTIA